MSETFLKPINLLPGSAVAGPAEGILKSPEANDAFLTRGELRNRWKCSESTLKRREKAGLKATYLGGRTVRYRFSDVLAFEQRA